MNILLVQPKISDENSFPLAISYLAAELIAEAHNVTGHDIGVEGVEKLYEKIERFKPDVIGFTARYLDDEDTIQIASRIKEQYETKIIFGGPQATAMHTESIKNDAVDFIVIGEGEHTIVELLDAIEGGIPLKEVDGIVFKRDGKIIRNEERTLIDDVDDILFPDREVFPLKKYCSGMVSAKTPYTSIITSRGCSFKCPYCPASAIWKGTWRPRSPVNVCDEIELLVEKYSIRDIHIEDDNFTVEEQRVYEFCDELIERKLNVVWECPNGLRPESLSPELLEKMSEAGCKRIAIGIESASPQLLDELGRCSDLDTIRDIVDYSVNEGIRVCGYFMIGLPDETKDMIEDTIKFSKTLNLDYAHYSVYSPIPGSALYAKGLSKVKLRQEELENIRKKAYLTFYARPKNTYRILKDIKSNPSSLKPLCNKILHCLG